jgi:gluconolactonase
VPPETPAPPDATLSLIASGAKVEVVAEGLQFAEGPVWMSDGRLIVSDVGGNVVVAFDEAGNKSDLRRPSNVSNGHALDLDGSVVEAEMGDMTNHGLITKVAADGSTTVLADNFEGKRFNSPNDLIVKSDGTIWFTDPDFGRDFFPSEIGFNGVYRLDPQTKVVTLLTNTLNEPNGIVFSPDEKTLYVSDTTSKSVTAFAVLADDTLGPGKLFGDGCDGLGVDEKGDVWASTCDDFVVITSPAGARIGAITFPGTTTNLAWGGTDGKTLFVTTQQGGVYSLALAVRGTH